MGGPERSGRTSILIVDDHPVMRAGLAQLIDAEEDLVVCCEAEDAHEALEAMSRCPVDLALVDLTLKDSSGLDLIKDIHIRWPKLPVLVLSMHEEVFYAERALRAGARGYIMKAEAAEKVIEGIRRVLAGGIFVSERASSRMLAGMVEGRGDAYPIDRLSDREFQVLELIGQGLQNREMADKLHLSVKTIEAHRENIKKKLNLEGTAELVKYAVQWVEFERAE